MLVHTHEVRPFHSISWFKYCILKTHSYTVTRISKNNVLIASWIYFEPNQTATEIIITFHHLRVFNKIPESSAIRKKVRPLLCCHMKPILFFFNMMIMIKVSAKHMLILELSTALQRELNPKLILYPGLYRISIHFKNELPNLSDLSNIPGLSKLQQGCIILVQNSRVLNFVSSWIKEGQWLLLKDSKECIYWFSNHSP